MTMRHFNDGWNAGLANLWSPPLLADAKAMADYKSGWQQARAELLLLLLRAPDGEARPPAKEG